jgi:hypothetical protein
MPGHAEKNNYGLVAIAPATTATATTVAATATAAAATAAVTTATTTTAAAAATTEATAAGRTLFTRAREVHGQGTTIQRRTVHRLDRLLRLFGRAHRDKSKSPGATALTIHHQVRFDHGTVRGKGVVQVVFGRVVGKIPYVQFRAHVMFLRPRIESLSSFLTVPDFRVSNHH